MKNKTSDWIGALIITVLITINLVYAQDLELNAYAYKKDYSPNETILIQIDITNLGGEFDGYLAVELEGPPGDYSFEDFSKRIEIGRLGKFDYLYSSPVLESIPNGNYWADIRILDSGGKRVSRMNISFRIQGVKETLPLVIETCKTQDCSQKSKLFLKNEDIYLNYESSVENPSITATLTYPDKTTGQITLQSSIKASQIGTYELEVKASKEGYKEISIKEQFGVIEKEARIETVALEAGEKAKKEINWLIIAIIAALIFLAIAAYSIAKHKGH